MLMATHPVDSAPLAPAGAWTHRAGLVLTGLFAAFMLMDSVGKVVAATPFVSGTTALGFPESLVQLLGAVELACVLLHLVPRTRALGAVLLTGWLGGAVAIHVHQGSPLMSHVLFPLYTAAMMWGGLLLRDAVLRRALFPRGGQ